MTLNARQARHKDLVDRIRHLRDSDQLEIILLDPDDPTAEAVGIELREAGISVAVFEEPIRAVAAAAVGPTSLFILSCHLSPHDLQAISETVQQKLGVPVVLACDRWDANAVGPAILAGARPAMGLPYTSDEVISAIDNLPAREPRRPRSLVAGELVMDLAAHDVSIAGRHVDLSPTEFETLRLLVLKADSTVARPDLAGMLWPGRIPPTTAITAVTRRLRRKLAEAGFPAALHTVRGLGYRLDSAGCARSAPIREVTRASTSSTMLATS